jgi:aspartate/methionine/tyrosine aminotransferase
MALVPEEKNGQTPVVLIPNPFYQVYMIGALSVNAEPYYMPATAETGHLPDFSAVPEDVLNRTAVAYLCSPSNPQGAIATAEYWRDLFALAEKYDFQIFADECYSEIYRGEAPVGALEIAAKVGADPERLVVFHSLSKRSNLPGLRSGFAAGGPKSIARMRMLRAYAGAPLPAPLQHAAAAVWKDEDHVIANRAAYAEKFAIADEIFGNLEGYHSPEGGFFLWLSVENGEEAAVTLWRESGVRVLPGEYLAQGKGDENPAKGFIRVALVADNEDIRRGLTAIRDTLYK